MATITFSSLESSALSDEIVSMMNALFTEDTADFSGVDRSKFRATVDLFLADPSSGTVIVIRSDGVLAGYALLVPYWSNEFGGRLVFVDELFVRPDFRNRGIGKAFFSHVESVRPYGAVACALETSRKNSRARSLYESLGFASRTNAMLVKYWG